MNMMHVVYLAKALLPQQLKRIRRSAMVVTSSMMAVLPSPGLAVYSSTKAAVSAFSECLHFEVKDKIDVVGWECSATDTKANPFDGTYGSPQSAV